MKEYKDIRDDQIRIIGQDEQKRALPKVLRWPLIAIVGAVILGAATYFLARDKKASEAVVEPEPALFEPEVIPEEPAAHVSQWLGMEVDSLAHGFTEIQETTINDIPLRIFIPHNAEMTLHVGRLDKSDRSIIYAAQAADVRADNGGIVGAFVLKGEPLAWGLSKRGYCASIGGEVTIGVAQNSPLFEKATEEGGYFFRQYPLVDNGVLVENQPKGKSIRRAICDRQGEIFMVETGTIESFHDFAQALVDLGVDQAVYLVGSSAYGWAVDQNGTEVDWGEINEYTGRHRMPKNTSYIVWRRK